MRRNVRFLLFAAVVLGIAISCGNHSQRGEGRKMEERLEAMRVDKWWIHFLDSLSQTAIGPGAKCLDGVKHTFIWDDRLWVYNQDWGGVLEIPEGYLVEDDYCQLDFSYHGTRIFSPDSLVLISTYAGCQGFDFEEFEQMTRAQFDDDSTLTVSITAYRVDKILFSDGSSSPVITMETLTEDGIQGISRNVYSAPGGIELTIFLQYPTEMDAQMDSVKAMVMRYPFGPLGQDPTAAE